MLRTAQLLRTHLPERAACRCLGSVAQSMVRGLVQALIAVNLLLPGVTMFVTTMGTKQQLVVPMGITVWAL